MPRNIVAPSARRPQSMRLRFSPRLWKSREQLERKFQETVEARHLELNPESKKKPTFLMKDVEDGGFQITAVVTKKKKKRTSDKVKLPKAVRQIIGEFNDLSLDRLIDMDLAEIEARKDEARELAHAIRQARRKDGATSTLMEALNPDVLAKMVELELLVLPGGKPDKPAGQATQKPAVA